MKSLILILLSCFVALCLLGFVFVHHMETEKRSQLLQREVDFLLKRNGELERQNKDCYLAMDSATVTFKQAYEFLKNCKDNHK